MFFCRDNMAVYNNQCTFLLYFECDHDMLIGISPCGNRKYYLKRNSCFECESLMSITELTERQRKCKISKLQRNDFQTTYFKDGKRKIDYVLTYECNDIDDEKESSSVNDVGNSPHPRSREERKVIKRLQYEANLRQLGLELEHVEGKHCKRTHFVLVHAPFLLLMKQAESVCLKMPVLQSDVEGRTVLEGILEKFMKRFHFLTFDEKTNERLKEPNYFTAPFIAAHLECYVGHENPDTFFDDSERSRLVYDLLIRTKYDTHDTEKCRVGIERLIKNGTYTSAFPLHEKCEWNEYNADRSTDREFLYWNWARITNICKYQPLSLIKKYFGSKVGWYFAWLGYYTKTLIPASVIGILCFIYGILTISEDIPSNDICGSDGIGAEVILCPTCDRYCDYTRLNSSCIYSKLSYVFDNTSTVIFAAMMSVFATLFLEGWMRYHAEVAWKWGLLDFEVDEETIRPEYQLRVKKSKTMRINPVTQQLEPYLTFTHSLSSVPGRHYFGLRPEECDPAGCMVELVIQLAIIMCGKQFWNGFVEFAWPVLMTWLRSLRVLETKKQRNERTKHELIEKLSGRGRIARWEQDYILNPVYGQFLFDEYLEMVIQFGFVTLFVSAFPLAPFFALLNNIFEIRVDAYKYVVASRRPVPERARDIGIWLPILSLISRAAVLVNACIIAFTSDFIPRFVYRFVYMHDELYGYVNNSLSFYDSSGIFVKWSEFKNENITICRFRDYRKSPCAIGPLANCDDDYGFTTQWWIVFTFRLAFILIFEAMAMVKAMIAYVIPNIPANIFIQLQRQRFLARQARISDITSAVSARNGLEDSHDKVEKSQIGCTKDELIFEPGKFEDEQTSAEFEKIMSNDFHRKAHSLLSLQTHDSESFYTCQSLVDSDEQI
ncbi:unnamed protein product [Onchocerca ochengi]|uniref:Anoctamin n=1 Tax=Onchocerca ochengi TaxID=42157 RepID=A0A182E1U9_ONCOC|nr:unnamed protein product [Onchocerca ochengi]